MAENQTIWSMEIPDEVLDTLYAGLASLEDNFASMRAVFGDYTDEDVRDFNERAKEARRVLSTRRPAEARYSAEDLRQAVITACNETVNLLMGREA